MNTNDKPQIPTPVQTLPPAAAELVASGASLVRLENTTMSLIAVQRPRNEQAILEEVQAELTLYSELATEAVYCKPVGRDSEGAPMRFAEEISIRGAETLAQRWSNSAFRWAPVSDDGEVFCGLAEFIDYERNQLRSVTFRCSRTYTRWDKSRGRWNEDRFQDVVIKAAASKALREVILRSMPAGLKAAFIRKAFEVMGLDKGEREKVFSDFSRLKVDQKQIERMMGKPVQKMDGQDLVRLRGVLNSIRDGQTTLAEAFELTEPGPGDPSKGRQVLDRVRRGKKGAAPSEGAPPAPPMPTAPPSPPAAAPAGEAPSAPAKAPEPTPPPPADPAPAPPAAKKASPRKATPPQPPVAPPADPVTDDQQQRLFGLFKERGLTPADKDLMKAFVSAKVGRQIEQTSQLTRDEMNRVLDALGALGGRQEIEDAVKTAK